MGMDFSGYFEYWCVGKYDIKGMEGDREATNSIVGMRDSGWCNMDGKW